MTAKRWVVLAFLMGAASGGAVARGQGMMICPGGINNSMNFGMMGMGMGMGGRAVAAFSATGKSTFEQRLVDGNVIHGSSVSHMARDSAGRTRTEVKNGCFRGQDGVMHEVYSVNVYDPVARTTLSWQVETMPGQEKVARLYRQPEIKPVAPKVLTAEEKAANLARMQKMREEMARQPARTDTVTERLGTKSFNGIAATGIRMIRTIPPGEEGNDMRLVVVNETWTSKELGVVMSISDDPRRGKNTYELVDVVQAEPDASVFAAPAGYRVEEIKPGMVQGIGASAGVIGGVAQ